MPAVLFYLPSLHRSLSPVELPENIVFFPTGTQKDADNPAMLPPAPEPARHAYAEAEALLPLGAGEAASVLAQALQAGQAHGPRGDLRQLAAARQKERAGGRTGTLRPDESAALKMFSLSGSAAEGAAASSVEKENGMHRDARIACQQVLLLAHALEEQEMESRRLEERCMRAENALLAALGEGGERETPAATERAGKGNVADAMTFDVPWTTVADAALAFLPEKAMVFSAHDAMVADLCAAEIVQPLAECRPDLSGLWREELRPGLVYARLPAWRLAGRAAAPQERPWLARHIEVVLLRPTADENL